MAPIAARGALLVLECVADVVGIEALLAAQALDLRQRGDRWDAEGQHQQVAPVVLAPAVDRLRAAMRADVPFWEDDGLLHPALMAAGALVRRGALCGVDGGDSGGW